MAASRKKWLMVSLTLLTIVGIFFVPPLPQPPAFHNFADTRCLWGIPNFANVVSNFPFLIIGIWGMWRVFSGTSNRDIRWIYFALFSGVILTGVGSAYYHWHPDNDSLVWDRLPMTIVFMAFLSVTIAEVIDPKAGIRLLAPSLAIGVLSVIWWHYTEATGHGDLRLYMWVQFYPMIAIGLVLWLYYSPGIKSILTNLILILTWYVIAKTLEQLDYPIFRACGLSGHSLKHLAAAMSTWYFIRLCRSRNPNDVGVAVAV